MLTRETFDSYAQQQNKTPSVIGRSWTSVIDAASFFHSIEIPERSRGIPEVNFENVLETVRFMETGKHHFLLVPKTPWNIIAAINNESLSVYDSEYLIPWVDHIHPEFRCKYERRQRAAERLADAYKELGHLALAKP